MNVLEIPQRIITGWGLVQTIGSEVKSLGKKVMVIHSKRLDSSPEISLIVRSIKEQGVAVHTESVSSGEPTVNQVEYLLLKMETESCNFVLGVGGGSILDLAKAVAGLSFSNRKAVKDYFYGEPITKMGLPWVAVPTTSGAGAEATPNAVLYEGKNQKLSIRHRSWLAKIVMLDPKLTVSSPKTVTAWSGMDALTQAIESYVSRGSNDLTEPYSLRSAKLIGASLMTAFHQPEDKEARTDMAMGSLLAGIALGNARLGIVHGVAHSIGIHHNVPHGLVCGTLLPWSIAYNKDVCPHKYAQLAKEMNIGSNADDLENWVKEINIKLEVPPSIKDFGVRRENLNKIIEESMPSGSLKANPKTTSEQDLFAFLSGQI
ncbi:iron-containing alcohol dehydrogenase [Evansella sp. AB-rgal1]|uniref:iron-containing alcohol dehydrogenase n=1 Tax=Evansella sp. AB-rgal1 TaxID=3242696 RepID=UPI00359D93DF